MKKDTLTIGVEIKRCSECDRVKIVYGKWIEKGMYSECSICKFHHYGCEVNYCPDCGAYMRGGKND